MMRAQSWRRSSPSAPAAAEPQFRSASPARRPRATRARAGVLRRRSSQARHGFWVFVLREILRRGHACPDGFELRCNRNAVENRERREERPELQRDDARERAVRLAECRGRARTTSASATVTSVHATTLTPAPNASHGQPGCLRRAPSGRAVASPTPTSAIPTGQRSDHPESSAARRRRRCRGRRRAARTPSRSRRPALTASTNARVYFSANGRSFSTSVDPVHRSLELAHRDRRRDERADQAERQREDSGAGGRRAFACSTAFVSRSLVGPGGRRLDGVDEQLTKARGAESRRRGRRRRPALARERARPQTRGQRAWLVPSAARSRTTASFSSAIRPVDTSVLRASSPVSSHVSLTSDAVLTRSPLEHAP